LGKVEKKIDGDGANIYNLIISLSPCADPLFCQWFELETPDLVQQVSERGVVVPYRVTEAGEVSVSAGRAPGTEGFVPDADGVSEGPRHARAAREHGQMACCCRGYSAVI